MSAISYTQFRKHLGQVIEEAIDSHEPVTVTRTDGRDFVIVPADQWGGWMETLHLLSSPKNVRHLRESLREIEAGKRVEIDIP